MNLFRPGRRLCSSQRPGGIAPYGRILSFFRDDLRLIGVLVVLIWVSLLAGVLEGASVGLITDLIAGSQNRGVMVRWLLLLPIGSDWSSRVLWLAGIWLALRLLHDLVQLLREMINHRLRYNGTARVRMRLFDHLQTLSPAYHKSCPQGDAIYRLSTDAQGFYGVLDTFIGAANSAATVLVIGTVMAGFNGTITMVCLSLVPLLLLANWHFGGTIARTSALSKQADTDLTTFVQRAMATVSLSQLFRRQKIESRRLNRTIDRTIGAGMRMSWQQQLYPMVTRMIYALGHAFVLGYGGYLVFRGRWPTVHTPIVNEPATFTVGGVTAMLVYLGQLWEPIRRMAGFTADVQNNVAACRRVFHVLDLAPTVTDAPMAGPIAVRRRAIELSGVEFAYEPSCPVLRGVDARIEPGEMVAFVGPSGAGKSTILSLLPRFYDPTGGAIWLDGHDLRELRLADIRAHIALVPQESPVIAGTIAENIAFGRPSATSRQIRAAAELAGADEFIAALVDGYRTPISEAGQNLSGGQRQRLAIARALLTEAPILVLDEPTSGLDPTHERLILDTLSRLKGKRTIILVTHNLGAVADCDCIYVLHNGKVAEAGTHAQLLAMGGHYAAMASMTALTEVSDQEDAAA